MKYTPSNPFGANSPDDIFVELRDFVPGRRVLVKIECFHPTGSIKYKSAREIIQTYEAEGRLQAGDMVVESSSGNMGVALAFICQQKGYRFTCVMDSNSLAANQEKIRRLGGHIHMAEPVAGESFLGARIRAVQQLLQDNPRAVWTNQYANAANALAHEKYTAPAIWRNVPTVDAVVVGAGTTGTLLGCMRYFTREAPHVHMVAVDSLGSVTFGGPSGMRKLPGMGAGVRPTLTNDVDALGRPALQIVSEPDTIRMCWRLLSRHGLLVGASTGTVLCGLEAHARQLPENACLVAISPDSGEGYLDTVYNQAWVQAQYPAHNLALPEDIPLFAPA